MPPFTRNLCRAAVPWDKMRSVWCDVGTDIGVRAMEIATGGFVCLAVVLVVIQTVDDSRKNGTQ
jgi:hypothetical protein